jgi:membrane protein YdbS with pleckstrin-like domain
MTQGYKKPLIIITALAGITGCVVDIGGTFIFGNRIPGYNQFMHTMSQMGIVSSPVFREIVICWITMGVLMILFGIGIRLAYEDQKKWAGIACVLVILYGFGEGMVSGIFPADKVGEAHTLTGLVHDGIGGIGVTAIMIFPLVMNRIEPKLRVLTIIVFFIGAVGVVLFGIGRLVSNPDSFLAIYKGSWQRLYVMVYYIYVVIIAIKMMCCRR